MPKRDPTTPDGARQSLLVMWTIRRFEEALEELFARGVLHGTMHLSIGQEAVAEGVAAALDEGDFITSTHRGHGHAIAHGADLERMFAELLMKDTGYCRGRGGSMHIADVAAGNLGANGIVAGSMTIATGAAFSQMMQGTGKVVACFFGDGAANEGAFHESLNLAGIWSLPVVFVCENNQYGMSMAVDKATAGGSIVRRPTPTASPGCGSTATTSWTCSATPPRRSPGPAGEKGRPDRSGHIPLPGPPSRTATCTAPSTRSSSGGRAATPRPLRSPGDRRRLAHIRPAGGVPDRGETPSAGRWRRPSPRRRPADLVGAAYA